MQPLTVAEQLAKVPEPCSHLNHGDCSVKLGCPCAERPDGKPVDFTARPPFTGTGLPRGGH